jgi:hypothetical protein
VHHMLYVRGGRPCTCGVELTIGRALHLVRMGTLPSVKPGGILGGMHRSRPCSCRPRARSVVRKESNQALGNQELIGFLGFHFFLVRTRVKASYTQTLRIPPIRVFFAGPASRERKARFRLHAWGRSARRRFVSMHAP